MDDMLETGVSSWTGRDPSSLEVLGSSSSSENKTLLTSNLYMSSNKSGAVSLPLIV